VCSSDLGHCVGLKADGTIVEWGSIETPIAPEANSGIVAIAAGASRTVAIRDDSDCDLNGIIDGYEISNSVGADFNRDYILDKCQQGQGISGVPSSTSSSFVLHNCYPNPFNPITTISFELTQREVVNLQIFDTSGRLVRVLANNEVRDPGYFEFVWHGENDQGHRMPSGVYFYQMAAGTKNVTKRMVLLK